MEKEDKSNLIYFPIGTLGRDMIYALVTNYLLSFILFTKTLSAAQLSAVTAIMIAARVFDALNDPVMGNIIERTRTKWGKFKPWLLLGILTTSAVILLMFCTNFEGWAFIAFFALMYFSYSITYTMHDISYWGMIPALSRESKMRDQLTSRATLVGGIGGTLANMLIPMLTTGSLAIGGSAKTGYAVIAVAVSLLSPLFLFITIAKAKEDRSDLAKAAPPVSFKKIISTIKNNDQLLWMCLIFLLQQVGNGIALSGIGSSYIYFEFGYSGGLYSIYTTLGMLPTAFLMIFYPVLSRKFGRRCLVKILSSIAIFGYIFNLITGFLLSPSTTKFILLTIAYIFANFGQYGLYLIFMLSILNTVEYNEYKNGTRDEAIIASLRPFFTKLASALTVLIATLSYLAFGLLGYTNRISDLESAANQGLITEAEKLNQIDAVILSVTRGESNALLFVMCLLPLALLIISSALYLKRYKIDEEYFNVLVERLKKKEKE